MFDFSCCDKPKATWGAEDLFPLTGNSLSWGKPRTACRQPEAQES